MDKDIRWKQRFENFRKALAKLEEGVEIIENNKDESEISDLVKEGLIQRFEFTHELSWRVMKDYLEYQGFSILGSRDAFREALKIGIINDKRWLDSIKARNLTSHTYDEDVVGGIYEDIINIYLSLMRQFRETMQQLQNDERFRIDE
ncbi:MAG: nucleotidyltransferase substrate binding protein [Muribaculaceae bacterium]|nr:nucleotidyltransferase substrate binding protein [Muribaculaceae bacterium]MDE6753652.1 nucleotidyltransferase substrate binding protein [Muribaculaceae bacterium]